MKLLIQYAMQFVGVNYKWGGDDPILGFDCSGWMQEILAAAGEDPPLDQTAQGLYNHFAQSLLLTEQISAGSMVFFGKSVNEITHVGFAVSDKLMLEAGGGGSKTTDKAAAARDNAYIRMRPIDRRSDFVGTLKPEYKNLI